MWNVPTDLLRSFIAVIDHRGYTRAADRLGRSQPTISLQIKRLQELLGVSLFEKDSAGITLTENGKTTASYARRILALNDELLIKLSGRHSQGKLQIGLPNDYADRLLPGVMASFSREREGISFEVVCDLSHVLLQGLHNGLHDLIIAMTPGGAADGAFMSWRERLAWVGGPDAIVDRGPSLRLICYPPGCLYRRNMLTALEQDGRGFDIVYTSPSLAGLEAAIASNFGITALAERNVPARLKLLGADWDLPKLDDLVCGIYLRDGSQRAQAQMLAARFAEYLAEPHPAVV